MTIDQAIETIVDSGEYLFYGTHFSRFDNRTLYKIRRRHCFQQHWGLNTERELFTLARLCS
jgi:hypothetical protein